MLDYSATPGDLVYIPSEVLLTDHKKYIRTEKPINALYLGRKNVEVKVFYNGSRWWVNKQHVYNIREQDGN